MSKGRIFSIEEFSVHDGPGIRMTVFLKGCTMRCNWCHNPEGQSFEKEIYKNVNGCTRCGRCIQAAKEAGSDGRLTEESVAVCPNHLLRICGTDYTPQELVSMILSKKSFFKEGGGVTFSGGEPLAQADFLTECLTLLGNKVHRALQTSGQCDEDVFRRVLAHIDYVLYDLKLMDSEESRKYTGADNKKILRNFEVLTQSGVPYVVRIPLIPRVTDTEKNLHAICAYMAKNGAKKAELLPYHKLSGSKYALIGRTYDPKFDENISVEPHPEIFTAFGIEMHVL